MGGRKEIEKVLIKPAALEGLSVSTCGLRRAGWIVWSTGRLIWFHRGACHVRRGVRVQRQPPTL